MNKDLVCLKEETKCNKIRKQYKNDWLWNIIKENIKQHNPNSPQIPDHSFTTLIIAGPGKPPTSYQ